MPGTSKNCCFRCSVASDEPVALVGYCLGGTMAIAAANLIECERVATLAAPWHFSLYPDASRQSLEDMWTHAEAAAESLARFPWKSCRQASGRSIRNAQSEIR